jgi:hypothetical protein
MNLSAKNAVSEWIRMPKKLVEMKGAERGGFQDIEIWYELAYRI